MIEDIRRMTLGRRRTLTRGLLLACAGVAVIVVGCSMPAIPSFDTANLGDPRALADAAPGSNVTPDEGTVGAKGGTVTTIGGSGVELPPGAVPNDVDVSVAPTPDFAAPPESAPVGTAYTLGPSGIQFAVPVTVILEFDPAKLPAGKTAADIVVLTASDGSSVYAELPTHLRDATHVTAETTHFSVFVPAILTERITRKSPDGSGVDASVGTDAGSTDPKSDAGPGDPKRDAGPPKGDPGSCTALLCGHYGPGACGTLWNGCSAWLECGVCPPASSPDAGKPPPSDLPDAGICMVLSCANYPSACGMAKDGCGGQIFCDGGCTMSDAGAPPPKPDASSPPPPDASVDPALAEDPLLPNGRSTNGVVCDLNYEGSGGPGGGCLPNYVCHNRSCFHACNDYWGINSCGDPSIMCIGRTCTHYCTGPFDCGPGYYCAPHGADDLGNPRSVCLITNWN